MASKDQPTAKVCKAVAKLLHTTCEAAPTPSMKDYVKPVAICDLDCDPQSHKHHIYYFYIDMFVVLCFLKYTSDRMKSTVVQEGLQELTSLRGNFGTKERVRILWMQWGRLLKSLR